MTLSRKERQAVCASIYEAAGAYIRPRFRNLKPSEVFPKGESDVVSRADLEAEAFLTRALMALVPSSMVLGEEAYSADPTLYERVLKADYVWTLDAVDGTKNFVSGKENYCTMVSFLKKNQVSAEFETYHSWIYIPEKDMFFEATPMEVLVNGQRLVRDKSTGFVVQSNLRYFSSRVRTAFRETLETVPQSRHMCLGSVGVDLCWMALGRHHASFYRRLHAWDHAPGSYLLRIAGGAVETLSRTAKRIADLAPLEEVHGLLACYDEATTASVRTRFQGVFDQIDPVHPGAPVHPVEQREPMP